jgi:hypothetical protein
MAMRVSPAEYLGLELRAHELLRGVPLYDVTAVDLPGGGAGRTLADVHRLGAAATPSRLASVLFGVRRVLGRVFGWDRTPLRAEDSLLPRMSERDRRDSAITPGTPDGPFLILYQFPSEELREITRLYLILIEPFRRILYPAMLRRIRRAWVAAYERRL